MLEVVRRCGLSDTQGISLRWLQWRREVGVNVGGGVVVVGVENSAKSIDMDKAYHEPAHVSRCRWLPRPFHCGKRILTNSRRVSGKSGADDSR